MKILIATPAANGQLTTRYAESLAQLCGALARAGIDYDYKTTSAADLEMSRNYLASTALALEFTHILFADADMGFRPRAVERMLAHGKPFVAAVCVKRSLNLFAMLEDAAAADTREADWARKFISRHMQFTGNPLTVDGQPRIEVHNGFARYHSIGMGLALIAREVLQQIVDRALAVRQRGTLFTNRTEYPIYGFFNRLTDAEGNLAAEDYSFCHRWQQCGGEVWVMLDEPIFHVGTYAFIGNFMDAMPTADRS